MSLLAVICTVIVIGVIAGYVGAGISKAIDQYFICKQQEKRNAQTRN